MLLNHQQHTKFQVMAAGVFKGVIENRKQKIFHFYN